MEEDRLGVEQEQKGKERLHVEVEEVSTRHGRVVKEELREMRIEVEGREERKEVEVESQVREKFLLPRPPTISLELRLASENLRPKVAPPSEVALTDRQRVLLYVLHNLF